VPEGERAGAAEEKRDSVQSSRRPDREKQEAAGSGVKPPAKGRFIRRGRQKGRPGPGDHGEKNSVTPASGTVPALCGGRRGKGKNALYSAGKNFSVGTEKSLLLPEGHGGGVSSSLLERGGVGFVGEGSVRVRLVLASDGEDGGPRSPRRNAARHRPKDSFPDPAWGGGLPEKGAALPSSGGGSPARCTRLRVALQGTGRRGRKKEVGFWGGGYGQERTVTGQRLKRGEDWGCV